jgi:hypothetical protein
MLLDGNDEVVFDTIVKIKYQNNESTTYEDSIPLSLKVARNELITPPDIETSLYEISQTNKDLLKLHKKT